MNYHGKWFGRGAVAGIFAIFSMAGCGGGGGGSGSSTTPPASSPPPVASAPDTSITASPSVLSASRSATFNSSSSVSGVSFEISIDGSAFAAATMPLTLTGLVNGPHTISIRARDAAGNVDPTPAVFSWTVDAGGPAVEIAFPPPASYTDAATLTVRGTGHDLAGIASISVNGTAAVSTDGFQTWRAEIPLSSGQNTIVVTAADSLGNAVTTAASPTITRGGPLLVRPGSMAYEEDADRLIVIDRAAGQIYAISSEGEPTVLTPRASLIPQTLNGLVLDETNHRGYLLTSSSLSALDLKTGELSIVSNCTNSSARDLAFDPIGNRVFVVRSRGEVIEIDLDTNSCTEISSGTVGQGPMLTAAAAIAFDGVTDPQNPRVLVGGPDGEVIIEIDVGANAGERDVFSLPGAGVELMSVNELKLDASNKRVLVVDGARNALLAADLQTGNRTIIADQAVGTGPPLAVSIGLAMRASDGRIFLSQSPGQILQINGSTLAREMLMSSGVGAGPRMRTSYNLAIEPSEDAPASLLVNDTFSLMRVDLATGDRSVVSSPNVGTGPFLSTFATFALDSRASRANHVLAFMGETNFALVDIDLTSGNRTLIWQSDIERGRHFISELRVDATSQRVMFSVVDTLNFRNDALYALNLSTLELTLISGQDAGSGRAFNWPGNFSLQPVSSPTHAIVANGNDHTLLSVDLSTGARSVISSNTSEGFSPGRLFVDAYSARLFGFDFYGYNVFSAPLPTGAPQPISGVSAAGSTVVTSGRGPMLTAVGGLDVNVRLNIAYATQVSASSIVAIDVQTGDRVMISR